MYTIIEYYVKNKKIYERRKIENLTYDRMRDITDVLCSNLNGITVRHDHSTVPPLEIADLLSKKTCTHWRVFVDSDTFELVGAVAAFKKSLSPDAVFQMPPLSRKDVARILNSVCNISTDNKLLKSGIDKRPVFEPDDVRLTDVICKDFAGKLKPFLFSDTDMMARNDAVIDAIIAATIGKAATT